MKIPENVTLTAVSDSTRLTHRGSTMLHGYAEFFFFFFFFFFVVPCITKGGFLTLRNNRVFTKWIRVNHISYEVNKEAQVRPCVRDKNTAVFFLVQAED